MENRAFLNFELCGQRRTIQTNPVVVHPFDIEFEKFGPACGHIINGENVSFRISMRNNSQVNLRNVDFRDPLPHGLVYVPHTFRVNGRREHPTINHGAIEFRLQHFQAGTEVNITFETRFERHHHNHRPPCTNCNRP